MSSEDTQVGQFVHHDYFTADKEGARAFYCGLAGWTTQDMPMGDSVYTMLMRPGGGVGGLEQLDAGGHPHWVAYLRVSNVALTLATVESLGGTVTKAETPIGPGSSYAIFLDPWGAACGVYASAQDPGMGARAGNGEFSWGELAVPDIDAALDFYTTVFPSWEVAESSSMGQMGRYQLFRQKGAPKERHLGGILVPPPQAPAAYWIHYISVPDLSATMDAVKAAGGQVLFPPTSVGGADLITQCLDPFGGMFALHSSGPDEDDLETVVMKAAPA